MTRTIDFAKHNEEVKSVWEAYRAGKPTRVPMVIGHNPRITMFDHPANPRGLGFEDTFSDPQLMLERVIEHSDWARHNLPQDVELGPPQEGWDVWIDFQNTYEAGWFGCELKFEAGEVPDTIPKYADEATKESIFDAGIPDPFTGGLMARNWEFFEYMQQKKAEGWEFKGKPIRSISPTAMGTDGPVTVACNLRGATEFMTDLLADEEYADRLMTFLTDAFITRIRAYRERLGQELKPASFGFADDSIQLMSTDMVKERVLPHYRRLVSELSRGESVSMHLCGNATRHFPMLRDELGVRSFDTGFPVDFGWLRDAVGDEVEILGGPSVPFLETSSAEQTTEETKRILESGIRRGGKFILREGNNLPPSVPMENVWAMYDAAKIYGRY